ncbi:MAG: flagellar M-ring protein FliF [Candidatus Thiodiazotropha sp. (ex Dulcina madagascariensis)]|nr:flagellar M-ring protein FliF [Candidatus Thiodiazotropha sp. (ex Dulcina madagascariensis)]MCU7925838.1 flagellar M-ring protein FliF [Candidatus Thiodiazotropha sp. (ex Dulcina madagascariensis)]
MSFLIDRWKSVTSPQKTALLVLLLVILSFPILTVYFLSQSNNAVLFSELNPTDSAKLVQELDKLKASYEIDSDGTRILVNEGDVHKIRLKMMSAGLSINGGVGFEIFDNAELGMTEFAQKINYQRALQGELTRTIMALDEVRYARVHLVLPDTSLFTNKKTISSAAVTLFIKPGSKIESKQVLGIQKLVASSVDKLEFNMVTISNEKGEILSRNHQKTGETESLETQFSKKKEIELYLLKKANTVLDEAIGGDKAAVTIDVSINFDKQSKIKEEVIPNKSENDGIIKKRHSNAALAKKKRNSNSASTVEIEYKLGKEIEQLVLSPGKIDRIKVAVLLKEIEDAESIEKIRNLVSMAVGLDASRGDEIYVHHVEPTAKVDDAPPPVSNNLMPNVDGAIGIYDSTHSKKLQQDIKYGIPSNLGDDYLSSIDSFMKKYGLSRTYLFAPVLLLFLFGIYFVLLSVIKRKNLSPNNNKLTQEERDTLLIQLQEWLSDEHVNQKESQEAV